MSPLPQRALLVVDVQHEYIHGSLQVEYPTTGLSLHNIGRAMDAAREAAIPIVVVSHVSPPGSPVFAEGSEGTRLHETVHARHHDLHITKSLPSVLSDTPLRDWIKEKGVDTLTLVGYTTNNCIDATVKQALHEGLNTEVLSDATGTFAYANQAGAATAEEIHRAFCVIVQSRFGAVANTNDWIAALKTGAALPRDTPVESLRRAHGARQSYLVEAGDVVVHCIHEL
jgi:nicotinamidase-related amidase